MSGAALEETAKKFLVDPAYQKVFKHTFDVFEDYICGFLVALGAISLSVRFLTSLGTGDAVCIIIAMEHVNGTLLTGNDISPLPSGGTLGLISYANYNQHCVESCLTKFLQYCPFILIIQAMLIIMTEKLFLRIPRVAGKIERFYKNIVEESMFGKDPDVAEDVVDDKGNIETIARRRRRNEVCMSLKRSSIIHKVYIFKNILEIVILLVFIPANIIFALDSEKNKNPGHCKVPLMEMDMPHLHLMNGTVHFQCSGKKVHFFLMIVYISTVFQICCIICSLGSLAWCTFFRSISRLLDNLRKNDDTLTHLLDIDEEAGQDFLFLFDLLSHTSGIESTMRVLTHSDETFRRICLPKVKNDVEHVKVEEDKLKVIWNAALIERWLMDNDHREIKMDSYDVTIFPAESSKNSVTKKAKLVPGSIEKDADRYSAWFFDLAGGKTEYIVTIACVIGKSRMKGARVVTTLLPYGAEKPRGGILKTASTNEVEIAWEPPKGDFTKYVLTVENLMTGPKGAPRAIIPSLPPLPQVPLYTSQMSNSGSNQNIGSFGDLSDGPGMTRRDISSKVTNFMIHGLSPGEIYAVQLLTKTGDKETRQPIKEVVLTKAEKVSSVTVTEIGTDRCLVKWLAPEGHSKIKAFNINWTTKDGKDSQEFAMKANADSLVNTFQMESIPSATEFSFNITTVCVFEKMKTVSDEEKVEFVTLPNPPRNLELENRLTNSFQVKWDGSGETVATHKYRLSINNENINYTNTYEINGDRRLFNFSKLPEILGTGEIYTIRIIYVVQPLGSEKEVESEALVGNFLTKPLPASNFSIGEEENTIQFQKSATANVSYYKLRCKSAEEGSKSDEYLIDNNTEDSDDPIIHFKFPQKLNSGVHYKVNIYAVVDKKDEDFEVLESKELHEKIIQTESGLAVFTEEAEPAE